MARETIHGENGPALPNSGIKPGSPYVGVEEYSVSSWYPTPDGSGKPQAVQLNMGGTFFTPNERAEMTIVLRLKTAESVDELCRALLLSRRRVWPNEPVNVY